MGIREGGDWNWRGKSIEGSNRTDRKNVLSTRRSGIGGSYEDTELVRNLGFFFTVRLFQSAFLKTVQTYMLPDLRHYMESSFYKAKSCKRKTAPQVFQLGGHTQFKSEPMALNGTGTT